MRRASKFSQLDLAKKCGLHIETIRALEAGRGTVASLSEILAALGHWFEVQYDPLLSLGDHLEERRRKMSEHVEGRRRRKITKTRLAEMSGVSRPSLDQVMTNRGQANTLVSVMRALGFGLDQHQKAMMAARATAEA
ncbi:MAG: helix-turn-helix domain-containing protein [Methylobacterium organophilum]|nr:helix-turn-helix domain-containing protein [Methylobacterium organophilum]